VTQSKKLTSPFLISFLITALLAGCAPFGQASTQTPTPAATFTATVVPATPTTLPPTATFVPTTTLVPTATLVPVYLPATVWPSDPQVPILTYHRFYRDSFTDLPPTKIRLGDFKAHLQSLYDAGYTLVSLEAWLSGDMRMPAGRKPLVITIDDLFSSDQIFLNPDGTPSPLSGIGLLWQFSQDHPDFGFAASIFYNMGDKHYGNLVVGDWWQEAPGWEESLAKAIAWCIQKGAMPYNHFYTHPELDLIKTVKDFNFQAQENEIKLRETLALIGQESLADKLGNMFAIPFGIWPTEPAVTKAMLNYVSTNNKPLLGLLDIDYAIRAKYLQPVYSSTFDRNHIPRIVDVSDHPVFYGDAIKLLVDAKDKLQAAVGCQLGPVDPAKTLDTTYLEQLIVSAGEHATCPEGVYSLAQGMFRLQGGAATEIQNLTTK